MNVVFKICSQIILLFKCHSLDFFNGNNYASKVLRIVIPVRNNITFCALYCDKHTFKQSSI